MYNMIGITNNNQNLLNFNTDFILFYFRSMTDYSKRKNTKFKVDSFINVIIFKL